MKRLDKKLRNEEYITFKPKNYNRTIEYGYPADDDKLKEDDFILPDRPMTFGTFCSNVWYYFKIGICIFIIAAILYLLNGCSKAPEPIIKPIVKVETQEVKVPVMPKIPELHCKFDGKGLEPTRNLLACLIFHKRVLEALRSGKLDLNATSLTDGISNYLKEMYPNDAAAKIGELVDDKK